MTHTYTVTARWDDEAAVWVAEGQDVPGLVTEAPTLEAAFAKLRTMVPALLELNGVLATESASAAAFRLITNHSGHQRALDARRTTADRGRR